MPLARGLLYFASSAPVDLFAYGSRIGEMPAYSTISNTLQGLSDLEGAVTTSHGCDPTKFGVLQFNNVQIYLCQCNPHIGCELKDMDPKAFDLDDKLKRLAKTSVQNSWSISSST